MSCLALLHENSSWLLAKQSDPRKWGRYGWKTYLGITWLACQSRLPIRDVWIVLQFAPAFLLCKYCSRHFYEYIRKNSLSIEQIETNPSLLFDWIVNAYMAVSSRMEKCGEQCWTQQWLQERFKTSKQWDAYFHKQMSQKCFYRLWLFEVLLFMTTTMRCLAPPESWNSNYSDSVIDYILRLLSFVNPKCINALPVKNTRNAWSSFWYYCLYSTMNSIDDADAIWNTSEQSMRVFAPKTMSKAPEQYLIHDNGGTPFRLSIENSTSDDRIMRVELGTDDEKDSKQVFKLAGFIRFKQIWIGIDTARHCHGNNVIVQMYDGNYIWFSNGEFPIVFSLAEDIVTFYSYLGNNNVPYPYIETAQHTILLLEAVYILNVDKEQYEKETGLTDPYDQYYSPEFYSNERKQKIYKTWFPKRNSVLKTSHLAKNQIIKWLDSEYISYMNCR